MFRVPISSRGYVNEDGISKVVLTAELPTEERYEISEVGIYSAASNPTAGSYDSKSIFSFSTDENWQYHNQTNSGEIPTIYTPLDEDDNDNIIKTTNSVFNTNADNRIFTNQSRLSRYERSRFLNNVIVIAGNYANLTYDSVNNEIDINPTSNHIHLEGATVDLSKNSALDELRLAFSVINKDGDATYVPDSVKMIVEFSSEDTVGTGEYARFEVNLDNGIGANQHDFNNNRYVVVKKQLQELKKTSGFIWSAVDVVKIFVSVIDAGLPSSNFFVCLDAMRLENVSTTNPLYGLTGYSVIKNTDAETIVKTANTTNFLEFRFAMDVQ
jgi:hypothetical protein